MLRLELQQRGVGSLALGGGAAELSHELMELGHRLCFADSRAVQQQAARRGTLAIRQAAAELYGRILRTPS